MTTLNKILIFAVGTAFTSMCFSGCSHSNQTKASVSKSVVSETEFETSEYNGFIYEKNDNSIILKKYKGNKSVVDIPSEIDDAYVISIDSLCFENTKDENIINTVVIPSSVENISSLAFYNSQYLKEILCDDNLDYASDNGILYTSDMSNLIAYPENKAEDIYVMPDTVTTISNNAFSYCRNLKKISLSSELKAIPDYTFAYNYVVKDITAKGNIKEIGFASFYRCSSLENITLPNTVEKINDNAIVMCEKLKSVNVTGDCYAIKKYTETIGLKYCNN